MCVRPTGNSIEKNKFIQHLLNTYYVPRRLDFAVWSSYLKGEKKWGEGDEPELQKLIDYAACVGVFNVMYLICKLLAGWHSHCQLGRRAW